MKKIYIMGSIVALLMNVARGDIAGLVGDVQKTVGEAKTANAGQTLQSLQSIYGKTKKMLRKAQVYQTDTKVGLEIKNKSTQPITVHLYSGDDKSMDMYTKNGASLFTIEPKMYAQFEGIDVLDDNILILQWKGTADLSPFNLDSAVAINKGKTVYLTYDDVRKLRPQTGPGGNFAYLLGITDTGLSMANNVKDYDITSVKEKVERFSERELANQIREKFKKEEPVVSKKEAEQLVATLKDLELEDDIEEKSGDTPDVPVNVLQSHAEQAAAAA